jgi:cold-inducible RNA-binding protein
MGKKVYVGNLPWEIRGKELREAFEKYGEIEDATVILDRETRRSKGFGFVTFIQDADADKAVAEMNGKELGGRELTVNEAKPREENNSFRAE